MKVQFTSKYRFGRKITNKYLIIEILAQASDSFEDFIKLIIYSHKNLRYLCLNNWEIILRMAKTDEEPIR